jgi:hypothetical protein
MKNVSEVAVEQSTGKCEEAFLELSSLELIYIGGGIGDVVFSWVVHLKLDRKKILMDKCAVEVAISLAEVVTPVIELGELDLVLVGGGIGDVIFGWLALLPNKPILEESMITGMTEECTATQLNEQVVQLAELELTLVGGGIGDVIFG